LNPLLEVFLIFVLAEIRIWVFDGMGFITFLATALPISLAFYSWYKRDYCEALKYNAEHQPGRFSNIPLNQKRKAAFFYTLEILGLRRITLKMRVPYDNKEIILTFFQLWIFVVGLGFYFNPRVLSTIPIIPAITVFIGYYFWALLQQLWMNGYFINRIGSKINGIKTRSITALLFAIIHLPNPTLFIATFIGGYLSAYYWQRNRNLYPLALFHALLAVTIKYFLPYEWHHNLTIGYGFYHWSP